MSGSPAPHDELFEQIHRLVTARILGEMTPEQLADLDALLIQSPTARQLYLQYVYESLALPSLLGVPDDEGPGVRGQRSGGGVRESGLAVGAAVELPHQLEAPSAEPLIPPIIIDDSPPDRSQLLTGYFAVGSWAFSYAAATLITGLIILTAWAWKVSLHDELAASQNSRGLTAPGTSSPGAVSSRLKEVETVGRITGQADCRWADPDAAPPSSTASVPFGRKYELSSGLMEITYETGAKVILEGPCCYEVDSLTGGFLSLGKLTVRVEKGSGVRGQGSDHYPLATSHYPLFSVRTPTAVVTDLGTEFGVEVDKSGATKSHVFRGKVELRVAGIGREGREEVIPLGENESVRVERGKDRALSVVRVARGKPPSDAFARRMPRRVPIELFNTGIGLKVGDPDLHWQLVARSDDPKFKPRPAVVTACDPGYLPNYPEQSQWLSTAGDLPLLPEGVTYTFRTTFELSRILPDTAVLWGRALADDHIDAIRLNGRSLRVPEHGYGESFTYWHEFKATSGFLEGTNSLEIDVFNGGHDWADAKAPTPTFMACRVELKGSVVRDPAATSDDAPPSRGKEGTSMNGP